MAKKDPSLARVRSMAKRFVHPFRITKGKAFRLKDVDPRDTRGLDWNIRATAAPHAPWYVVPADHKGFTRLVVEGAIVDALAKLDLRYPTVGRTERSQLREARRVLMAERG
jgi:hypothetical protein